MKETVKQSLEEINKQEGLSVFTFLCSRALLWKIQKLNLKSVLQQVTS